MRISKNNNIPAPLPMIVGIIRRAIATGILIDVEVPQCVFDALDVHDSRIILNKQSKNLVCVTYGSLFGRKYRYYEVKQ